MCAESFLTASVKIYKTSCSKLCLSSEMLFFYSAGKLWSHGKHLSVIPNGL